MLDNQLINLPFGVGVDEKVQEELLEPGQNLLTVQNLRISKTGSFMKRKGYDLLARAGIKAKRLGQRGGAPILFDGENINTYVAQTDEWATMQNVSTAVASRTSIVSGPTLESQYDIAYANGIYAVAYTRHIDTSNYAYVTIIDAATGNAMKPIQYGVRSADALRVRVLAVGDTFVLFLQDSSTTNVNVKTIDSLNPTGPVTPIGDIIADASALPKFDVVTTTSQKYAVAYKSSSGPDQLTVSLFTPTSATPIATNTRTAPVAIQSVGVGAFPLGTLWVGVNGPVVGGFTTVSGIGFNVSTLAVTSNFGTALTLKTSTEIPQTITIAPISATTATFVAGNSTERNVVWGTVGISGGNTAVTNFGGWIYRYEINGKAFRRDKRTYLPISLFDPARNAADQIEPTGYLVQLGDDIPFARIGYAFPITTQLARIVDSEKISLAASQTVMIADDKFVTIYPEKRESNSTSLDLVTFDFANTNLWENDELNTGMVYSAGTPSVFDGLSATELGFLNAPQTVLAMDAASVGNLDGVYQYIAVYEWVSSDGQLVQSAPSLPATTPNLMFSQATITVPTLQISYKFANEFVRQDDTDHPVRIVLYRTSGASGTVFQRLPDSLIQVNDHNVPFAMFTDNTTDAVAQAGTPLYSQPFTPGTPLPKFCPPSASCMAIHRNRVWLVGDDGITVWYSGQFVDGEQAWFSDLFTLQVPKGGPITALESMDGVLYIFKKDFIFSVTGDGPSDNGSGNDLSVPEEMDIEVGCIEPRSVIVAPGGIFYQSPQGLYMLSRSRSVAYIGKNIDAVLKSNPIIVSAALLDKIGCIYWELSTEGENQNSYTAVYDYFHNQWMLDTKTVGETSDVLPAASGIVIDDSYYWITATGVFERQGSGYFDAGQWVTGLIDTAWLKMAGLQGFQRVRQMDLKITTGQFDEADSGPFGMNIDVYRDYENVSSFQTATWTSDEIAAFTTPTPQLQVNLAIQKVESLSFEITDLPPISGVATGLGPVWTGIGFEVGIKRGSFKLPAENTK